LELHKGKVIQETLTKKIYSTNDPKYNILHFKDTFPGTKSVKESTVKNKGQNNAAVSAHLFKFLQGYHVPTHYVDMYKPNELLIHPSEPIPIQIIVWNGTDANLARRFGFKKGTFLSFPIMEMVLQDKKLHNPLLNKDHACALGITDPQEIKTVDRITRKINAVLKSFFGRRQLKLARFEITFGRFEEQIFLIDELSMDNLVLWETREGQIPGKGMLESNKNNMAEEYTRLRTLICQG
jgi:phosphoribosylaminoimidazole-succinocarboxamide synthase